MQNKLYVGNLSFDISQRELEEAFGAHGAVRTVNIVMDRETGRPRGFAFIEMENEADAKSAIDALDGQALGGRQLKVNEAKPRENRRW